MLVEVAGVDGSGKTTQMDRLSRVCHENGIPSFVRTLRSTFRRVLDGIAAANGELSWRSSFDTSAVEFATALEMHQLVYSTILPINFPGQLIVTDTYILEWLATAIAQNVDVTPLTPIYNTLPRPDLSVQLDVSTDEAFDRILKRPKGDHLLRTGGRDRLAALEEAFSTGLSELAPYSPRRIRSDCAELDTHEEILQLIVDWATVHDEVLAKRLAR